MRRWGKAMWRDRVSGARGVLECLLGDERGGVAIYAALVMPLLLGSIGLGVDVGLAYSSRQTAQHQADAGAMAAALEVAKGKTTAQVKAAATISAQANGFTEAHGDVMSVQSPPTTGAFAGNATAAEV